MRAFALLYCGALTCGNMPVFIEVTYSVKLDAPPPWKITTDTLKVIDGQTFAKLWPYDASLVNLVVHELQLDLPKKKKLSLASCVGFKGLLKISQRCGR